ncbi:hypothetical protein M2444_005706 [Paenibacillus sp. PastF-3]|uniref:hypothetical protein n=1 Tax=Paenibacillus TaxID=44249 RepID=UPI000BA0BF86|nr:MULTISPECIES: hypothetical protein [unclassified Paenibacillus]MDH6373863.1 hypothetical protein [Paenibacillus sp. PastF-3]OZQ81222.1 hypothetical protein CA598_26775 [Paenibacillus sp. VTT E-133291]
MNLQNLLLIILGTSGVLLVVLLVLLNIVQRKLKGTQYQEQRRLKALLPTRTKEKRWLEQAHKTYPVLDELPLVKKLLHRMRSRLTLVHAGNEIMIRSRAAALTLMIVACILIISLSSFLWTSSWVSRATIMLVSVYLGGVLSDLFIGRLVKQMLYDQSSMILDIRHEYHQTHMVQVSLENSAERSKPMVAVHARQIAGILAAVDPEDELQKYYEIAPNRYMKQLAGVSYKIGEYGDADIHKGERSIYLSMLGNIREEIHMDINRRERIDRLLYGIVFVAISPVFMLDPIRNWAEGMFPIVSNYYNSAWGLYSLILLYITFIISFIALRILKGVDEDTQSIKDEGKWLNRILKKKWIFKLVDRITPAEHEPLHFKVAGKLKDANSGLSQHAFFLQKTLAAVVIFTLIVSLQFSIHANIKHNILYPNKQITTGGNQTESQKMLSEERYAFEQTLIGELVAKDITPDQMLPYIQEKAENKSFLQNNLNQNAYAAQLMNRVEQYHEEYYKWYELLLAFGLALAGFYLPDAYLIIRTQLRKWEMQNEVDGFNTLSMMLSQFPNISVYEMIEWLHRYSYIFERQLLRCMLDYEAGGWSAIENLKEDARFVPLERLADRLQVAADLIPVKKAFDDMDAERAFAMDQRKEHYEKVISRKSTLGKMFGFLPMQATFTLYLLLPFVYMAFQQLGDLTVVTGKM